MREPPGDRLRRHRILPDTAIGSAPLVWDSTVAFHPHAGTLVETPEEIARFARATHAELVALCIDVGHVIVGGGDPVAAIIEHGERVMHVHLKDVAREPLGALRSGELPDLSAALRARIFTELGAGMLDLAGVLRALHATGYAGWLMVEQDTSWGPPSEAAAIGLRVLRHTLRRLAREADGAAVGTAPH